MHLVGHAACDVQLSDVLSRSAYHSSIDKKKGAYYSQTVRIIIVTALLATALAWSIQELPAAFLVVSGNSMYPFAKSGQIVLVNRYIYRFSAPDAGDVVAFRTPNSGELAMKRVSAVAPGPRYHLLGDNCRDSLDSRHFGWVSRDEIIGRVESLGRRISP